jgi:hypothetical protein
VAHVAVDGGGDEVAVMDDDVTDWPVAGDEHERVDAAQRGAQGGQSGVVGDRVGDRTVARDAGQLAARQRDDSMSRLSREDAHDLAADPAAGACHRDAPSRARGGGNGGLLGRKWWHVTSCARSGSESQDTVRGGDVTDG